MTMSRSQARVIDPVLSQVALGYKNARYVGTTLMPIIECPKSGVRLMKFGKEAFVKYSMRRAPGAKVARVQYGYAAEPISLVQDSLEAVVPREWMRDTDDVPAIKQASRAVNTVMNSVSLGLECEIAEIATNSANYSAKNQVLVGADDKWVNPTSKLQKQMQDYKDAVRMQIGIDPNVLVLTPADFNACKNHPEVKERFKYTSAESITAEMLANFFELDEVQVGKAVWTPDENTAVQNCWTDSVLAFVPEEEERDMGVPSFGYTYVLDDHPLVEEPYFDKSIKSWLYPMEYERRPYQTSMNAGFLIRGAGVAAK